MFEKIVLVTRKTRLEELLQRYGSERQARFHIERGGGDFDTYAGEHARYRAALEEVRRELAALDELRTQPMDRELVKSYLFSGKELIVTLGQDGLVANTAKYVGEQPIIAVNPDPERIDGILLPFLPGQVKGALRRVLAGDSPERRVTLAKATLSDGQELLAFNDFFIGARSHVSARYELLLDDRRERQSSSGIIVSTGAGSTGWLSSVLNMAGGISVACGGSAPTWSRMPWEDGRLVFAVREPFLSKSSQIGATFGFIAPGRKLVIESQMPSEGVLFSDGVEQDYLQFNSGMKAAIEAAEQKARLVTAK